MDDAPNMKDIEATINTLYCIGETIPSGRTIIGRQTLEQEHQGGMCVKDAFDSFKGLPEEHPLRKKFDRTIVETGFDYVVQKGGFDANKYDCHSLFPYMVGFMIYNAGIRPPK